MQDSVPEVTDLSDEPEYILNMYGPQVREPGKGQRQAHGRAAVSRWQAVCHLPRLPAPFERRIRP
jgi:hypothetical protein